jgi:hypothetical protein
MAGINRDNNMMNEHQEWKISRPPAHTERGAERDGSGETFERRWHDTFVNGWRRYSVASEGAHGRLYCLDRNMEWTPELPAPRARPPRANSFHAISAEDLHTAHNPTDPNYFSDPESERTASVAEEYKEAERAERAASDFDEDTPAQQLVVQKENSPPSTKKHDNLAQQEQNPPGREGEMAGRGRGRPGGGTNLKGITWEYDPSIKLESKPIELFPVCYAPPNK